MSKQKKINMRTYNYYGVKLTSHQGMKYEKYLDNNKIAPNTMSLEEIKQITLDWLSVEKKQNLQ